MKRERLGLGDGEGLFRDLAQGSLMMMHRGWNPFIERKNGRKMFSTGKWGKGG